MRNIFLIIVLLLTLSSCSSEPPRSNVKRSYSSINKSSKYKNSYNKFSYHSKPSESMQAGSDKSSTLIAKNYKTTPSFSGITGTEYKETSADIVDSDGKYAGHYKVGNPYEVLGAAYFPEDYEDYEEIGVASWYGDDFHGKPTANGEIYDTEAMTAAHPTLPLPSMIKVTNLRNGKSVIVRVNDRGPFAKSRVIDLSARAAEKLGYKDYGTTEVKIELLRNETDKLLKKLKLKNDQI